jgi:hypothetical protein
MSVRSSGISMKGKKHRTYRQLALVFAILVTLLTILAPFFLWFLPDTEFQLMGDFEVFGFESNGLTNVENAIGRRFGFLEGNLNVSVPSEDCRIETLKIVRGSEKGSAPYNTTVFEASGDLEIQATNTSHFFYDVQNEDTKATLHFNSESVRVFLPEAGYPSTYATFFLESNTSTTFIVSSAEANSIDLFLDFGATDGVLLVTGDQNFSLPLEMDRAGIMLTVSIPRNRAYSARIEGNLKQANIEDWEIISCTFPRGTDNKNSFKTFYPKGEFAYDGKSKQVVGSQNLNFSRFYGVVHIMPPSDSVLFRVLIGGNTPLILLESAGRTVLLTPKTLWDIPFPSPFPFPWIGFAIIVAICLWHFKPSRKDAILLLSIAVFLFGILAWAIYTEKSLWVQNVIAYAVLLVTVLGYLIYHPRETASKEQNRVTIM